MARYDEDNYLEIYPSTSDEELETANDRKIRDQLLLLQKTFADLELLTRGKRGWHRVVHLDIPHSGYELEINNGEWIASAY